MGETNRRQIASPPQETAAAAPSQPLPETPPGAGIEELLQQRQEIDALLQEKFRRDVTILFTDIQGRQPTAQRGDVDGRLMINPPQRSALSGIAAHDGLS
jgi:class 3 adenylate cyclase